MKRIVSSLLQAVVRRRAAESASNRLPDSGSPHPVGDSEKKLQEQNAFLNTAITKMSQGLAMFDAEQKLVLCNSRYARMYELSAAETAPGTSVRAIEERKIAVGIYGRNASDSLLQAVPTSIVEASNNVLHFDDGRTVVVAIQPMPNGGWVATHEDITEHTRLQKMERDAKETLSAIIDASPVGIICVSADRNVMVWSRAAEQIFGYTSEECVGQPYKLIPKGHEAEFDRFFKKALAGEIIRDLRVKRQRKDGTLVDVSFDGAAMYDEHGVKGIAYALSDITERKKVEEQLKHLAHFDQLTGLPNRVTLRNELHELIDQKAGQPRHSTAIVMFDLDGFKDINDTLGHSMGDRLLQEIGRRLSVVSEGAPRVYRLGGDEFVATFAECGDPRTVALYVDGILRRLSERFEINGQLLHIGASAGIAIAPADGSNVEDLIANADLALYEAKSSGGNAYRLFLPAYRAQAQARRTLDLEIRRAFADNEFELFFQPQLRLSDGKVMGAEALLRWRHPQRGIIGPHAFIEALAASTIVQEAGRWILRNACMSAAGWRAKNLPPIRVGVNLFPAQFREITLLADVEAALLDSGLPADALELEITENIALHHDEAMIGQLKIIRAKGVSLAFDDFGTGYASLKCLTRYPLTRIKIDQSFVRVIGDQSAAQDTAIVRSLIGMAHHLGLEVIAEGVETEVQADFLRAEGCEEAQGFVYAKPLPAAEFESFLRSSAAGAGKRVGGRATSTKPAPRKRTA